MTNLQKVEKEVARLKHRLRLAEDALDMIAVLTQNDEHTQVCRVALNALAKVRAIRGGP